MNQILIPPLIMLPKNKEWDECGGYIPEFYTRTINFSHVILYKRSNTKYEWSNNKSITIPKNSSQFITLPIIFITSLPTVCVLIVDSFLYRYNIYSTVNIVPNNDVFPQVKLFNNSNHSITIKKEQLKISCYIVLTQYQTYDLPF